MEHHTFSTAFILYIIWHSSLGKCKTFLFQWIVVFVWVWVWVCTQFVSFSSFQILLWNFFKTSRFTCDFNRIFLSFAIKKFLSSFLRRFSCYFSLLIFWYRTIFWTLIKLCDVNIIDQWKNYRVFSVYKDVTFFFWIAKRNRKFGLNNARILLINPNLRFFLQFRKRKKRVRFSKKKNIKFERNVNNLQLNFWRYNFG